MLHTTKKRPEMDWSNTKRGFLRILSPNCQAYLEKQQPEDALDMCNEMQHYFSEKGRDWKLVNHGRLLSRFPSQGIWNVGGHDTLW